MKEITSINNPQVKAWKKMNTKKGRSKSGAYLVEGYHLVEEAIKSNQVIRSIVVSKEEDIQAFENLNTEVYIVSDQVAKDIADTETSQGIFAEIKMKEDYSNEEIGKGPYLVLDGIQDPGNLGTLIRTADACGISNIVLGKGTVDPYNSKTLRSAQGSHFRINFMNQELSDFIPQIQNAGVQVFGTILDENAISYREVEPLDNFALIVGNEGNGMSEEVSKLTDQNLYIPMKGQTESLNAAIAASIVMFHLYR